MLITDDNSWLDLRTDAEATVKGRLISADTHSLTIQFADWSQLVIDTDYTADLIHFSDEEIEIEVVRTEDGLFATADAITDCIVQLGTV